MSVIKTMTKKKKKKIATVANIRILSNTQYEILSNIGVPERIGTSMGCQNCEVVWCPPIGPTFNSQKEPTAHAQQIQSN